MIVGTLDFEFFPIKKTNLPATKKYRGWIETIIALLSLGSIIVQVNYLVTTINLYRKIQSIYDNEGKLSEEKIKKKIEEEVDR